MWKPKLRRILKWQVASGLSWAEFVVSRAKPRREEAQENVYRAYVVSVKPLIHSSHSEQHLTRHDDSGRTKLASLEHLARDTGQTLDLGDRHVSFGSTGVEQIRIARGLEPSRLFKMISDIPIGEDSAREGV